MLAITGKEMREYLFKDHYLEFAYLNVYSIRYFHCMVLRSFHALSQCDFRSNVIRPKNPSYVMKCLSEYKIQVKTALL